MDTYFIAGSAADPDFAKAELLVDKLIKAHPRIELVKDMRHPCEWQEFRQFIVQSRGFSSLGDKAIIWRKDGMLVGGINDFANVLSIAYRLSLDVDNQLIADITAENLKTAEDLAAEDKWTPILGEHKKVWNDGNVFDGIWKEHKPYRGLATFPDGSTYEGTLRNGLFQGQGTRTYTNGAKFQGMYQKGKREGKGKYDDGQGNIYEGQYSQDKCHGKGTRTWPDGRTYTGHWHENHPTGSGVEKRPRAGKEGKLDTYEGEFVEGVREGQGRMLYHEGHKYEGNWSKGLREGLGSFTWKETSKDAQEACFTGVFVSGTPTYGHVAFGETGISVAYPGEIAKVGDEKWVTALADAAREWWEASSDRRPVGDAPVPEEFPFKRHVAFSDGPKKAPTVASHCLTEDMWNNMRGRVTKQGMQIVQCIAPSVHPRKGMQTIPFGFPDIGKTGVVAADADSYVVFRELFDAIIAEVHNGYDAVKQTHVTNTDASKLSPPLADSLPVSCKISLRRSLAGVPAAQTAITVYQRGDVEKAVVKALQALKKSEPWAAGEYFPLMGSDTFPEKSGGCSQEDMAALKAEGLLFEPSHCFDTREFVHGRGVFHSNGRELVVHVNKEEHCELTLTTNSVEGAFKSLFTVMKHVDASLTSSKLAWAHSNALGYILSCPNSLGTGMVMQLTVRAPRLARRSDLAALAERAGLQLVPDGVKGESITLVCPSPLGKSEVEVANSAMRAVDFLTRHERALQSGRKKLWLWDDTPKITVTGPPSSSKRALAKHLAKTFGVPVVSASELLAAEAAVENSELGATIKDYVDKGYLVPPRIVAKLVSDKLSAAQGGWVVEGFPRSADQAQAMIDAGCAPNKAIFLEMDIDTAIERCTGRATDPTTGLVHHPKFNPAPEGAKGRLVARGDDTSSRAVTLRLGQHRSNSHALGEILKEVSRAFANDAADLEAQAEAFCRELPLENPIEIVAPKA